MTIQYNHIQAYTSPSSSGLTNYRHLWAWPTTVIFGPDPGIYQRQTNRLSNPLFLYSPD